MYSINAITGKEDYSDIEGPASSTDHAVARFDGTTGKKVQDSTMILDDSGNISGIGNITISTSKWLGLGAAAGRIEFDDQATDEINFLDCNVGIGTASPDVRLHLIGNQWINGGLFVGGDSNDNPFGLMNPPGGELWVVTDNRDAKFLLGEDSGAGEWGGVKWIRSDNTLRVYTQAGGEDQIVLDAAGNVGIGATTLGTSAAGTIGFANGTAPSTDIADQHAYYSADQAAGNAAPHWRTENGSVIKLYQVASYTPTNAGTDRSFDANAVSIHELADVVGSLIVDLQSLGVLE